MCRVSSIDSLSRESNSIDTSYSKVASPREPVRDPRMVERLQHRGTNKTFDYATMSLEVGLKKRKYSPRPLMLPAFLTLSVLGSPSFEQASA